MNRAVFLDRDNTIIHNDGDLGDPQQVRLIQGAATAIASLCGLGYKVVVITNQGGVARGKYGEDEVLLVHERIDQMVRESANGARIDRFYYCPYHPEGTVEAYRCEHPSRKPNPGMLLEAAEDLDLDLSQCWTIGDQVRDVRAGAAAGTRTILLRSDADLLKPIEPQGFASVTTHAPGTPGTPGESSAPQPPDYIVRTLTEAVRVIAHARRPEAAEHLHRAHVAGKRFDAAAVAKLQKQAPPAPPDRQDEKQPAAARGVPRAAEPDARRTSGKPFRPWSKMPSEGDEDGPDAAARVRDRFRKMREQRGAGEAGGAEPQKAGEAEPGESVESVEPAERGGVEDKGGEAAATPAEAGSAGAVKREPSPPWASIDQTLRLMLQELRSQRGTGEDFSYLYVVAIVLQMVAALCLVGGLWMGAGDDALFLRWIASGLLIQLATIAALLFAR